MKFFISPLRIYICPNRFEVNFLAKINGLYEEKYYYKCSLNNKICDYAGGIVEYAKFRSDVN